MAAQMTAQNVQVAQGAGAEVRESPLGATPNTALLAQIAAQMRAFQVIIFVFIYFL